MGTKYPKLPEIPENINLNYYTISFSFFLFFKRWTVPASDFLAHFTSVWSSNCPIYVNFSNSVNFLLGIQIEFGFNSDIIQRKFRVFCSFYKNEKYLLYSKPISFLTVVSYLITLVPQRNLGEIQTKFYSNSFCFPNFAKTQS